MRDFLMPNAQCPVWPMPNTQCPIINDKGQMTNDKLAAKIAYPSHRIE